MRKPFFLLTPLFVLLLCPLPSGAWNDKVTHKDLSEKAAEHSVLSLTKGDYLKKLGLEKGLGEEFTFNGTTKTVKEWFGHGSIEEDAVSLAGAPFFHHFHDPLLPWDQAGLSIIYNWQSSLLWAQNKDNDWSWPRVREYYYQALTSSADVDRQAYFAKTFKGLGHIIHLIQDAAQPAHVRNDPHPLDDIGIVPQLEYWAKKDYRTVESFASTPIFPAFSPNLAPSGYVPITPLWDTNRYEKGISPAATLSPDIGLTEFTQANFLSDDTVFSNYPYPSIPGSELWTDTANNRLYLKKLQEGVPVQHLAAVSWLYFYRLRYFPQYDKYLPVGLDDRCHYDYASHLIPRAVGYSAALINYFFRGEVEIAEIEEQKDANGAITGLKFKVKNLTPDEVMQDGQVWIAYRYKAQGSTEWTYGLSEPVTSGSLSYQNETTYQVNFPNAIPSDATEIQYTYIFKGTLGTEVGAVLTFTTPSPSGPPGPGCEEKVFAVPAMDLPDFVVVFYDTVTTSWQVRAFYRESDGQFSTLSLPNTKINIIRATSSKPCLTQDNVWNNAPISFAGKYGLYPAELHYGGKKYYGMFKQEAGASIKDYLLGSIPDNIFRVETPQSWKEGQQVNTYETGYEHITSFVSQALKQICCLWDGVKKNPVESYWNVGGFSFRRNIYNLTQLYLKQVVFINPYDSFYDYLTGNGEVRSWTRSSSPRFLLPTWTWYDWLRGTGHINSGASWAPLIVPAYQSYYQGNNDPYWSNFIRTLSPHTWREIFGRYVSYGYAFAWGADVYYHSRVPRYRFMAANARTSKGLVLYLEYIYEEAEKKQGQFTSTKGQAHGIYKIEHKAKHELTLENGQVSLPPNTLEIYSEGVVNRTAPDPPWCTPNDYLWAAWCAASKVKRLVTLDTHQYYLDGDAVFDFRSVAKEVSLECTKGKNEIGEGLCNEYGPVWGTPGTVTISANAERFFLQKLELRKADLGAGNIGDAASQAWQTLHTWKPVIPSGEGGACVPAYQDGAIGGSPDDFAIPEAIADTSEQDPCNPQTQDEWDPSCTPRTRHEVLDQLRVRQNGTRKEVRKYWVDYNEESDHTSDLKIKYLQGKVLMARWLENAHIAVVEISRPENTYDSQSGEKANGSYPDGGSFPQDRNCYQRDAHSVQSKTQYCLLTSWEQKAIEGAGFSHTYNKSFTLTQPLCTSEGEHRAWDIASGVPSGTFIDRCAIEWSPTKKLAVVTCWLYRWKVDEAAWEYEKNNKQAFYGPMAPFTAGLSYEYAGSVSYLVNVVGKTITKINLDVAERDVPAWTTEYGKAWAQ